MSLIVGFRSLKQIFKPSLCLVLISSFSHASLLETHPGSKEVEGVKLLDSATYSMEVTTPAKPEEKTPAPKGKKKSNLKMQETAALPQTHTEKVKMKLAGSGLRIKKVAFIKAKVYVAEWMIADSATWNKSIEDLKALAPVAMRATFVRDVDSEKIESAFREALQANKFDLEDTAIKSFLKSVVSGGEIKKGQTFTLLGIFNPDGSETLKYESAGGVLSVINAGPGFLKKIYSIWFGEVTEDALKDLKASLLGG